MAYNPIALSSTLDAEAEKLAYISARTLFSQGSEPLPYQSIVSKRSVGLVAGAVFSALWLVLASLLALSKSRETPTTVPIVYMASDYQLTNPPLYAYRKEPIMIP